MKSDIGARRSDLERAALQWVVDLGSLPPLNDALESTRRTYARVEAMAAEYLPSTGHQSRAERAVERIAGADLHHAWMYKVRPAAASAAQGPLSGKRLVVKDVIAVAGVPMTMGSAFLGHFVPEKDATVVERALRAGATLVGTAVCEDLCYSGSSFTSATGPVLNPYDRSRAAGGSTSGCGVLLATEEADIAVGTDLGGSVRNPAAWCGVSALKPTFGLVPYTGAVPTEFSMDHLGLMARTAQELAIFLDVVAGRTDDSDPRQAGVAPLRGTAHEIDDDISTLRVGIVGDGFGWPGKSDARVDRIVREAAVALGKLCAGAADTSIPLHRQARDIHVPISCEGGLATVFDQNTQGSNHTGFYDPDLAFAFGRALETNTANLPLNGTIALLAGTTLRRETKGRVLALAQRLRSLLRAQYEEEFRRFDILVMPTVPMLPHLLPTGPLPPTEHQKLAFEMHDNNCAFNLTGHPALSVPCGMIDALPVGMLMIGRHLDDQLLLRAAHQFQKRIFATPSPGRSQ